MKARPKTRNTGTLKTRAMPSERVVAPTSYHVAHEPAPNMKRSTKLPHIPRQASPVAKLPASRAEARAQGLKRYDTGVPCRHGHVSPRYTSNRQCVECMRLRHVKRTDEQSARYNANITDEQRKRYNEARRVKPRKPSTAEQRERQPD